MDSRCTLRFITSVVFFLICCFIVYRASVLLFAIWTGWWFRKLIYALCIRNAFDISEGIWKTIDSLKRSKRFETSLFIYFLIIRNYLISKRNLRSIIKEYQIWEIKNDFFSTALEIILSLKKVMEFNKNILYILDSVYK